MALKRHGQPVEGKITDEQRKLRRVQSLKQELAGYELYGKDEQAETVRKELSRILGKEKAVPSKAPERT